MTTSARVQRQKAPFNILFFGTDDFALETLRALHENKRASENKLVDKLHVVSTSNTTSVAEFARREKLHLLGWPLDIDSLAVYNVGVLVSFGRLVPKKVISKFPLGILNVHPSLLPRWRGATPIVHTVLSGDRETGVSVISIQPKHFDTGPILKQTPMPVPPNCSAFHLSSVLASKGADMLMETLAECPDILERGRLQADTGVSYAHKVNLSMSVVNWKEHSSCLVQRQYRAVSHLMPLKTTWNDQPIKLLDMVPDLPAGFEPPASRVADYDGSPGSVVYDKRLRAICIKCQTGWTCFRSILMKKTMKASDFYNGYLSEDKHKGIHFQSAQNGLFGQEYLDFVSRPKAKTTNSKRG